MQRVTSVLARFLHDDSGPTTTEYAVMLALIVAICIGAISGVGTKVEAIFTNLDTSLPTGTSS